MKAYVIADVHITNPGWVPKYAAEVHQHVGLGLAVHAAVVRQGDVTHHAAISVGPRREPQIHDHE